MQSAVLLEVVPDGPFGRGHQHVVDAAVSHLPDTIHRREPDTGRRPPDNPLARQWLSVRDGIVVPPRAQPLILN